MKIMAFCLMTASAALLHGAAPAQPGPPPGGTPITWPPTAGQCVRNTGVPFAGIGAELTRLYADPHCSTPPVCLRPSSFTTRSAPDAAAASILWDGRSNHRFTTQEQDLIGSRARRYAIAITPIGTRLYRLTFSQDLFVVPRTPSPVMGRVFATAYYARCVRP